MDGVRVKNFEVHPGRGGGPEVVDDCPENGRRVRHQGQKRETMQTTVRPF